MLKKVFKFIKKKNLLNSIYFLSLFLIINSNLLSNAQQENQQTQNQQQNAPAKSSSNSTMILFGIFGIVIVGGVVFVATNKKNNDNKTVNTNIKKVEPTNKAKIVTAPVTPTVPPVTNTAPPVTPQVPPVNTAPVTPTVPPVTNTAPPVTPQVPPVNSSTTDKKLFDSNQLDNDLDSLFNTSSQSKIEQKDEKKPLFDSNQLDNDLDALFVESNKVEAPKEDKKGLFDTKQLDNDLDSLFTESSPLSSKEVSNNSVSTPNDDLSSLFSMSTPLQKEEEKPKQSSGTFDLDSLDFLSSSSEKKEQKKEETFKLPSLDLSSLVDSEPKKEEPKNKIDLSTTTVGLNISDYLSSINNDKKEENKTPEFSLTSTIPPQSLNLNDLLGQAPVSNNLINEEKEKKEDTISIGKMTVQQSALDEIIKKAEKAGKAGLTTTQVITAVKGKSLDTLLVDINNIDGILGSIIVGKDGLVIANTMPDNVDKDLIGALTSSLFSNIDVQVKKLSKGLLKRLTVETDLGVFILTEIEMGTLVVLGKDKAKPSLSETFKAIATVTGKR